VLQFACGTAGDLRAAIGTAGGVDAWGVRAEDVRLDPESSLPLSWPWGKPMTVTLLMACGPGRDPAVVRAAALQHITGSVRLVAAAPPPVAAAGGAGAAAAHVQLPAVGEGLVYNSEALVAVVTASAGGSLRATLTFPARERPAAASGAAAMQVTLTCRGEALAGTPLNLRASIASLGNGTGAGAGCFGDCYAVAVHAQLNRVYVADAANRRIVMFDSNTGAFLRNIGEGQFQSVRGVAVHPVTGELWAADHNGRLLVFDPESGAQKRAVGGCHYAWGCTFNADGSVLYVAETSYNRVAMVRPADGVVTSYLANGAVSAPFGLCVDAAGHVVVACNGTQRLSVWKPATGQEVRGITDAGSNWTSMATHNGTVYAVAGGHRNDVSVIDAGSTTVSRRITTSADGQPLTKPYALAVHDGCLLVACSGTGRVHVLPL
jgi:DNA-binding beta-propeller fold protein YncE